MSAENYPGLPLPIHVFWYEASVQKISPQGGPFHISLGKEEHSNFHRGARTAALFFLFI